MHEALDAKKRIPTVLRFLARCVPERWIRVRSEGLIHIPAAGPVVIAARHYHHLYDGVALLQAVPRPIHFVVTLDWTRSAFTWQMMTRLTNVADWSVVARERAREPVRSSHERETMRLGGIRNAIRLLHEGSVLVIFPEGYPNVDPHFTPKESADAFLPFNPGFARIAALANRSLSAPVPIVPAGLYFHRSPGPELTARFGKALFIGTSSEVSNIVSRVEAEVVKLSAGV